MPFTLRALPVTPMHACREPPVNALSALTMLCARSYGERMRINVASWFSVIGLGLIAMLAIPVIGR